MSWNSASAEWHTASITGGRFVESPIHENRRRLAFEGYLGQSPITVDQLGELLGLVEDTTITQAINKSRELLAADNENPTAVVEGGFASSTPLVLVLIGHDGLDDLVSLHLKKADSSNTNFA